MVGPLALDLNYASRGDREARVSVSSPSGNEALPFGHSGNQSISGTHSLPVCLPSSDFARNSDVLELPRFCGPMLRRPRERQLAVGRSVGRPLSERNGGCCGGRGSGIALAAMVGAPGLWLPRPHLIDRSGQRGPLPH